MTAKPHVERPQTGGGGVGLEPQLAEIGSPGSDRSEPVAQRAVASGVTPDRVSPDPLQPTDRYRLVTPYTLRL